MDRRSWPWKKKSSDKAAVEKAVATLASAGAALPSSGSQAEQVCSSATINIFLLLLYSLYLDNFDKKHLFSLMVISVVFSF